MTQIILIALNIIVITLICFYTRTMQKQNRLLRKQNCKIEELVRLSIDFIENTEK